VTCIRPQAETVSGARVGGHGFTAIFSLFLGIGRRASHSGTGLVARVSASQSNSEPVARRAYARRPCPDRCRRSLCDPHHRTAGRAMTRLRCLLDVCI
jgi:hypothetical protein